MWVPDFFRDQKRSPNLANYPNAYNEVWVGKALSLPSHHGCMIVLRTFNRTLAEHSSEKNS